MLLNYGTKADLKGALNDPFVIGRLRKPAQRLQVLECLQLSPGFYPLGSSGIVRSAC